MYEPVTTEDYKTTENSNDFLGKLELTELTPLRIATIKIHIHII